MTVTLYQMRQFDKWASRSAEKKRIEAQQKAIRPFLKPVQQQLPLKAVQGDMLHGS